MCKLRLFHHSGPGHYIGSDFFAFANTQEEAAVMIRDALDESGLDREPLRICEIPIFTGVFHDFNGDY